MNKSFMTQRQGFEFLWYNSNALKTGLDRGGPKAGERFISELQR